MFFFRRAVLHGNQPSPVYHSFLEKIAQCRFLRRQYRIFLAERAAGRRAAGGMPRAGGENQGRRPRVSPKPRRAHAFGDAERESRPSGFARRLGWRARLAGKGHRALPRRGALRWPRRFWRGDFGERRPFFHSGAGPVSFFPTKCAGIPCWRGMKFS